MNTALLLSYIGRIAPGAILTMGSLALIPRRFVEFRICIYIALFLLLRDAMTPLGIWQFGTNGFFWLRFIPDPMLLINLGAPTGLLVLLMNRLDPELKHLLVWKKTSWPMAVAAGLTGALVIAAPSALLYYNVPLEHRGGAVPSSLLGALLVFSLIGNLYEEVLFRGYVQGYFEKTLKPNKAALLGGLTFAFGHIFLASTVTDAGVALLAFAFYEGLIAAFLRMRFGLVASTLAHGVGIFLLASGLI